MTDYHWSQVRGLTVLLAMFPAVASANAGLPMIVPSLGLMAIGLVPIIIIEQRVMARSLNLPAPRVYGAVTLGNLVSTVIGIPLTWLWCWFAVGIPTDVVIGYGNSTTPVAKLAMVTLGAAWLPPVETDIHWMAPAAMLMLLVPFGLVSWAVESVIARRSLPEVPAAAVRTAVLRANLASYALLALGVVVLLVVQVVR